MKFQTYIPCDVLKPFIRSFIVQETDEEATYKVLPDTGLVIGFQYQGRLSRLEQGEPVPLSISGISGIADHARIFQNTPRIGTVLVFFKEAGASAFLENRFMNCSEKALRWIILCCDRSCFAWRKSLPKHEPTSQGLKQLKNSFSTGCDLFSRTNW